MQEVFEAESLPDEQVKHAVLDNALELDDASFTWDALPPEPENRGGKGNDGEGRKKEKAGKRKCEAPTDPTPTPGSVPGSSRVFTSQEPEKTEKVFKIQKTSFAIPKGQVVAIVGQVGSGKSSFIQGLIGEMRRETGSVKFCGSVSYCPQNAWIQVCLLIPCCMMSHLTERSSERYHPRERLFRPAFRF